MPWKGSPSTPCKLSSTEHASASAIVQSAIGLQTDSSAPCRKLSVDAKLFRVSLAQHEQAGRVFSGAE